MSNVKSPLVSALRGQWTISGDLPSQGTGQAGQLTTALATSAPYCASSLPKFSPKHGECAKNFGAPRLKHHSGAHLEDCDAVLRLPHVADIAAAYVIASPPFTRSGRRGGEIRAHIASRIRQPIRKDRVQPNVGFVPLAHGARVIALHHPQPDHGEL